MKVRYIGPHQSGVDVVMPDGRPDEFVEHHGVLDTTSEHAAGLLEQPNNWEPADERQGEPSEKWKRAELDLHAASVGVENPEKLGTKAEVLEAIAAAGKQEAADSAAENAAPAADDEGGDQ